MNDERTLWQVGSFTCLMVSCCSGAELQVRRSVDPDSDGEIVLRELYPMKSDLYERARELEMKYSSPRDKEPRTENPEPERRTQNAELRTRNGS